MALSKKETKYKQHHTLAFSKSTTPILVQLKHMFTQRDLLPGRLRITYHVRQRLDLARITLYLILFTSIILFSTVALICR